MNNPLRAGLDVDHLTEADLLLANPETHTHPYGSHPLLPIHDGYERSGGAGRRHEAGVKIFFKGRISF